MREEYRTDSIVVSFDPALCIHVAECLRGAPDVFNTLRRPWVQPEAALPEALAEVVQRCPSGALQYERLDGTLSRLRSGPADRLEPATSRSRVQGRSVAPVEGVAGDKGPWIAKRALNTSSLRVPPPDSRSRPLSALRLPVTSPSPGGRWFHPPGEESPSWCAERDEGVSRCLTR